MPSSLSTVGPYLNQLYRHYDRRYLMSDPVQLPHAYSDPRDAEIVSFFAALFAFGNVTSILSAVRRIVACLAPSPYRVLANGLPSPLRGAGKEKGESAFHRWITQADLWALCAGLQRLLWKWGSLKACFLAGYDPRASDLAGAISQFTARCRAAVGVESRGLRFLFNDPATGAACKRLNMFLRWVVRPADGIDLGLWPEVAPRQLTIPVDTHIARISRFLGLTRRRTTHWTMAREVTEALRRFAPDDPCKYDFALTRIGIAHGCRGYRHPTICPTCPLDSVCQAPRR